MRDTFVIQLSAATEKYHHALLTKQTLEPPQPDALRIMFIGDSFTYGVCDGVGEGDNAYPAQFRKALERTLQSRGDARKVQVFNLSTPSYSPTIYGALLRDFAPAMKPHLVILAVDDSDVQDDYLYKDFAQLDDDGLPISVYPGLPGVPQPLIPLARHSKLMRLLFAAIQEKLPHSSSNAAQATPDGIGDLHNRLGHYRPNSEAIWTDAITRTMSLVSAIVRYCKRNDIAIMLLNYPYVPAVTTKYNENWRKQFGLDGDFIYEPYFHRIEATFAKTEGVPYYDFTDYLRSLSDHSGLYCELDAHFTPKANGMLAEQLMQQTEPLIQSIVKRLREESTPTGR